MIKSTFDHFFAIFPAILNHHILMVIIWHILGKTNLFFFLGWSWLSLYFWLFHICRRYFPDDEGEESVVSGLSFMWIDCENSIGDVLEDIIVKCFFTTRMLIHESSEIKYLVFIEEKVLFE